jgi:hypothetical protein
MIDLITNEQLKLSDIPNNNDISGANRFAHSFNGYEESLDNSVEIGKLVLSKLKLNETNDLRLTAVRKSLFFYFRRSRCTDYEPEIHLVTTYLNLIRKRITEKDIE